MSALILSERRGAVCRITFNRPEKHNAFTPAMEAELLAAIDAALGDPAIRVIVLAGAGKSFSSGVDLNAAGPGAAEVTDAVRARLLELAGYDVQVVEFVALEHTPKNVLLRATRTSRPTRDRDRLTVEYRRFADELGIDPALERLLADVVPVR